MLPTLHRTLQFLSHLPKPSSRTLHTTMPPLTINTTRLLPSGHAIPALGYGVYQTPSSTAQSVVTHALHTGYRHIDSAVAYRNEAPSAAALHASSLPRSALFFTTKVAPKAISYAGAQESITQTLQTTGLDYIDLYLLHAPYGGRENRLGAWKALVEGVAAGHIRSIGVSNYGVHHLEELEAYIRETDAREGPGAGGVLSVNQVELHPWLPRRDIVEWCRTRGVVLEAYSPLVRATKAEDPLLVGIARKYGKTAAQVLVRWSLQKGFVPLPKSVTPARIEENANVYDFELSEEDMKALDLDSYKPCAWDPTTSKD